MIKNIFPVNVYIEDIEKDNEWSNDLSAVSNAIFLKHQAETGSSRNDIGDNEIPLFTEENIAEYPILNGLREIFIDGFYALASSYDNNTLTREIIKEKVCRNIGKLPFMKKHDYKSVHDHVGASAFAIFYLSDVDNDKHGGQLVLRDPSFNSNQHFSPTRNYKIETKKNRLVVAPAYVWHEVTPYLGEEDRITIVINLDFSV